MLTPHLKCGRSCKNVRNSKEADSQMFMVHTINTCCDKNRKLIARHPSGSIKPSLEKTYPLQQLTAWSLIKLHVSHYQVLPILSSRDKQRLLLTCFDVLTELSYCNLYMSCGSFLVVCHQVIRAAEQWHRVNKLHHISHWDDLFSGQNILGSDVRKRAFKGLDFVLYSWPPQSNPLQ